MNSLIALASQPGSPQIPVRITALFLCVFLLIIAGSVWARRKRDRDFALAGASFGFQPEAQEVWPPEGAAGLNIFNTGHHKRALRAMRGSYAGFDLLLVDYAYGSGKTRFQQTLAMFSMPGASLPAFSLRPENIFDRMAAMVGFEDIDFPTFPEFSRKYLLRGRHEAAVRSLFDESTISFFEQSITPWTVEATANWIAVYRWNHVIKSVELQTFLEEASLISRTMAEASERLRRAGGAQ